MLVFLAAGAAGCSRLAAGATEIVVRPDRPNTITFPAQPARHIRLVIREAVLGQPCIDELEVYGPNGKANLAAARRGAKATASSCLAGYAQHAIQHLNDGRYGNNFSWISARATNEWAQIELPAVTPVSRIVFSRDRSGHYRDRVPIVFEVQLSRDGEHWKTVARVAGRTASNGGNGVPAPPPPPAGATHGAPDGTDHHVAMTERVVEARRHGLVREAERPTGATELLQYALLGEEHAWLKRYGYADLSGRLVPYNGRVKEYPRHVAADVLPLPPLDQAPRLDGRLDDSCWQNASRGVVRVAHPDNYFCGPLVTTSISAGHAGGYLYLAIRTTRLLSGHLAVVSCGDKTSVGVLAATETGLRWHTFTPAGKLRASRPVAGARNESFTCFEARLPLDWFPNCRRQGLRVGLGMGGTHTRAEGRAVSLVFSPWALAQTGPCVGGMFPVRLHVSQNAAPLHGTICAGNTREDFALSAGQSKQLTIAGRGPIGPAATLTVRQTGGGTYSLHLLRYDPLERTLALMEAMARRFRDRGIDVAAERRRIATLRACQRALLAAPQPDRRAERDALFDAHCAKRRLLFRAPDLRPLTRILLVKRHAFEPSHNYSVILDARYRPGGGVFVLAIPHRDGRLVPDAARLTRLFDAAGGIARNPVANADLSRIYFALRRSAGGYFHIMSMDADGQHVTQLTSGPFHDYWPCPLPDGGLAFISTRCRSRYLCWRPQAAVLFRMDVQGRHIRPLSFANLTEWAPSVMRDGRIIWQRSEYIDKGADFSHTLWAIHPDGTHPELVFGNDIIQPNGYANGRQVPGSTEILCTLISHFGDLNGPLALVDPARGRFNPRAITSLTPEVPWPGMWPKGECFRDPVPVARNYFLCAHAPRDRFGIYLLDRFGNREILYLDPEIGSMCPTPLQVRQRPPVIPDTVTVATDQGELVPGELFVADVYRGIEDRVRRGSAKYIRVCQEVRAELEQQPDGSYRRDHPAFLEWYATPVHKVSGPYGWPSYVAKASLGIAPIEPDGSARFRAPAGKVLYFELLDEDFNELQRMRSFVQLQPGERRSCVGCHERRRTAPPSSPPLALARPARPLAPPPWGAVPFAYQDVVQPVWDRHCVRCHDAADSHRINLAGTLDVDKVPASYRTLIEQGWIHYLDYGWNSGGNEKRAPRTFGTVKSKLWKVLNGSHFGVALTREEKRRIKCWTDLNCPLWPDYVERSRRTGS